MKRRLNDLEDLLRFCWSLRPNFLARTPDHPWVYCRGREDRLIPHEQHGVICDWEWHRGLRAQEISPYFGSLLLKRSTRQWPISFRVAPPPQSAIDVSFIIAHRGIERLPLLHATLQSIAAQREALVECIVVEQEERSLLHKLLPSWVEHIHTPPPEGMAFNKSWSLNVGAKAARGRVLVLHDGDICAPRHYAREVLRLHRDGYEMIRLLRFLFHLDPSATEHVCRYRALPRIPTSSDVWQNWYGGSIAIDRQRYLDSGGHDEAFFGWGFEDVEFFDRCKEAAPYFYAYLPFVHLHHERNDWSNTASAWRNRAHFNRNWSRCKARLSIPASERIAELSRRAFGDPKCPAA